jgi:hypothetical protein
MTRGVTGGMIVCAFIEAIPKPIWYGLLILTSPIWILPSIVCGTIHHIKERKREKERIARGNIHYDYGLKCRQKKEEKTE